MSAAVWPVASCQDHLEGAATSFVTSYHLNVSYIVTKTTRTQEYNKACWSNTVFLYLMCEVEVWVHLDHLPAAISVLIDPNKQTGVVLFTPLNVKMSCL